MKKYDDKSLDIYKSREIKQFIGLNMLLLDM